MAKTISCAFISTTGDIYAIGLRKLSAYLTKQGFKSELLFFPGAHRQSGYGTAGAAVPDRRDIDALVSYLKPYSVVGISAFSDFFAKADAVGAAIAQAYPEKILLMGGVAAIVDPEACMALPWVDGVCTGEGELATETLIRNFSTGRPWYRTHGFYSRDKRGMIHRNPPAPLIDVDKLPILDYRKGKIVENGSISSVMEKHLQIHFGTTLWVSGSRGCPFHCAYCINSTLPVLHKLPRFHSKEYVVSEILQNLNAFPFFNSIYFNDESVTAQRKEKFHAFLDYYRSHVGIPWSCYADPFTITDEDIDRMISAGCKKFKIGMQSGSGRVSEQIFDRKDALNKFPSILKRIDPVHHRLSLTIIDLIEDVPWTTKKDKIAEVKLINSLPRPFTMEVFELAYYPGTKIYNRAVAEKIIRKDQRRPPQDHVAGSHVVYAGIFLRILGMVSFPPAFMDMLIRRGWVFSSARIPVIPDFLKTVVNIRKLVWQLWAGDPTILPYRVGKLAAPSWGQLQKKRG